jgi:ATP-dependent DNA ligase
MSWRSIDPMIPKEGGEHQLDRPGYILEQKFDGTRVILYKQKEEIHIVSRRKIEYTHLYPELVRDAQSIRAENCIIDGELTFFREDRDIFVPIHTSRGKWMKEGLTFCYMAFDILEKDDKDLRDVPLLERKNILSETVKDSEYIRVVPYLENNRSTYERIIRKGEGVVLKPKQSLYHEGKKIGWIKIKHRKIDTAWVVGITKGAGEREKYFGALILAERRNNKLYYKGKVGSGFDKNEMVKISKILKEIPKIPCPFPFYVGREIGPAVYYEPKIKIRVSFRDITKSGVLKTPIYEGLIG